MDTRRLERKLRVLAVLFMVLFGSYQVAVTGVIYERERRPEAQPNAGFALGGPWPSVVRAGAAATAAGLAKGDVIEAVQGQPFEGRVTVHRALEKLFPGDRIRVQVRGSDGKGREISWQLEPANQAGAPVARILFAGLIYGLMPWLCLVVGFWTVFARPRELQAWLLLAMMATFAHSVVHPGMFPTEYGRVGEFFQLFHTGMNACWALAMLLFAWEFPRRTPWQQRQVWPAAAFLILIAIASVIGEAAATWGDPLTWGRWLDRLEGLRSPIQVAQMLGIGFFFALLFYKRFVLTDVDARRRLQTILAGAMVALTPLLIVLLVLFTGVRERDIPEYLLVPAIAALFVFPFTLGYVIVVQRAFGLSMVIRQGLQYALARRGVRIFQAMLVLGTISTAVLLASQPGMNRPRILQVVAGGTIAVMLLQRAAEALSKWVDRRFFREAYNAELVLANLSEDVRRMVETGPLLEAVATRISDAFHIDRIALLLHQNGGFQPAYAIGLEPGASGTLPEMARTAEVLRRERSPLRVYLDDSTSWVYMEGLSPQETSWLGLTGTELLLPLAVKDKLLGIISLGRKRSEEPYSGGDLRLLQSVALQTGLALENSQLAAAVTEAVAQRERLNREVEIAHEVQERLFPQNLPEINGLDYWGYCRPARGVGGDSYDFMLLESGVFGISIGDVSGKGIPASLLMASLQSALRGQASSLPPDLGVMITHLNRLIYDSSPSNRYATLFYGQFDPISRCLTYVNGGHCPPMVVRGKEILRLEEGGPVVGLFRPARFQQGTFQLEAGDVLVGFTDGISEAMNAADDEWGEDALGEFLLQNHAGTARELIPKIVAAADAFADGHPQHDDMTLIVVRFL